MDAKLGNNPSYIWRSHLWGRTLLEEGIRWRVGDGSSNKTFDHKWVPKFKNNLRRLLRTDEASPTVQHFIRNGQWDIILLRGTFPDFMIEEILQMSISSETQHDSRFWIFDSKGKYLVKDGYRVGVGMFETPEYQSERSLTKWWKFLWSLKIPPKVRMFWWRMAHDIISTERNFLVHHVPLPGLCPFCHCRHESAKHALLKCPFCQDPLEGDWIQVFA